MNHKEQTGIISYAAYIPFHRLERKQISHFFGASFMPGERSVAGYDEDSVSMGVEAARSCLRDRNSIEVERIYFATTSSPYKEKSSIPTMIQALDLKKEIEGIEVDHSLRAGTSAIIQGLHQAEQGHSLLVAADCRLGGPSGANEQLFGDGAAAILLGNGENVIARVVDSMSVQHESIGQWRSADDLFVQSWEERFQAQVISDSLTEAMHQFSQRNALQPAEIAKVVISVPGTKSHLTIAKKLGFKEEQIQDPLLSHIGSCGCAHAPMMLIAALEEANPQDKILLINYGEGLDVILLEATEAIQEFRPACSIVSARTEKTNQLSYQEYLKWKGLLETEKPRRPETKRPSVPAMYRNYKQNLGFYGSRCTSCGTPQFPKQRICAICQAKDQMEEVRFVGKKATVTTFTTDYLAASLAPAVIVGVIDFEGGGRIMCEITDCHAAEVTIGMEVEMTFRRLYEAGGIHNYFWKAKPKREIGG